MDEKIYNNALSYASVLNSIKNFKRSGTKNGGDFNTFDTPTQLFFKITFAFSNGDVDNNMTDSGLLAPTWLLPDNEREIAIREQSTAWAYLKNNGEDERADMLQSFVELLSNINTQSPWYFNTISGLEAALDRKPTMSRDFKIDEDRKKISIVCLPDSYDERIGTLLDLYREIVWSWQLKKAILPANLKKFDMGIFLFSSPISNIIRPKNSAKTDDFIEVDASFNPISSDYITSYKYFEFHNCEINYDSSLTGYQSFNNTEGITPTYTIDIYFDDCYETRYNEFMMRTIGDMIKSDSINVTYNGTTSILSEYDNQQDIYIGDKKAIEVLYNRTSPEERENIGPSDSKNLYGKTEKIEGIVDRYADKYEKLKDEIKNKKINITKDDAKNALNTAMEEVAGAVEGWAQNKLKSIVLGNLYEGSLTQIYSQIKQASKGHISSTLFATKQYLNGNYSPEHVKQLGNLHKAASVASNI